MRTAVLLSGQIRNARDASTSIKEHIVDKYNADVFVETWRTTPNIISYAGHNIPDDMTLDEVDRVYSPKMMRVEDFDNSRLMESIRNNLPTNKTGYNGEVEESTVMANVFAMYYKIMRANEMREEYERINNIKYECIIRLRFDLKFDNFPVINPEANTVYIPNGSDWRGGVGDLVAVSDRKAMSVYSDVYNWLYRYNEMGHGLHPESILRKHLEFNKLKIERFPCNFYLRGHPVV